MNWDIVLATLFIIICILLIIVVLLQKGRGGGLGAAFGGAGSSAFGTRTGDVFTWVTIVLTALFLLLAVGTNLKFRENPAEALAAPLISPPPGPISEPVPVTIQVDRNTQAHYTLDGSDPTEKSPVFKENLKIEPGTTLKAVAVRNRRVSKIVGGTYTKATSQPAPTPTATSNTGSAPAATPTPKPASAPAATATVPK